MERTETTIEYDEPFLANFDKESTYNGEKKWEEIVHFVTNENKISIENYREKNAHRYTQWTATFTSM